MCGHYQDLLSRRDFVFLMLEFFNIKDRPKGTEQFSKYHSSSLWLKILFGCTVLKQYKDAMVMFLWEDHLQPCDLCWICFGSYLFHIQFEEIWCPRAYQAASLLGKISAVIPDSKPDSNCLHWHARIVTTGCYCMQGLESCMQSSESSMQSSGLFRALC